MLIGGVPIASTPIAAHLAGISSGSSSPVFITGSEQSPAPIRRPLVTAPAVGIATAVLVASLSSSPVTARQPLYFSVKPKPLVTAEIPPNVVARLSTPATTVRPPLNEWPTTPKRPAVYADSLDDATASNALLRMPPRAADDARVTRRTSYATEFSGIQYVVTVPPAPPVPSETTSAPARPRFVSSGQDDARAAYVVPAPAARPADTEWTGITSRRPATPQASTDASRAAYVVVAAAAVRVPDAEWPSIELRRRDVAPSLFPHRPPLITESAGPAIRIPDVQWPETPARPRESAAPFEQLTLAPPDVQGKSSDEPLAATRRASLPTLYSDPARAAYVIAPAAPIRTPDSEWPFVESRKPPISTAPTDPSIAAYFVAPPAAVRIPDTVWPDLPRRPQPAPSPFELLTLAPASPPVQGLFESIPDLARPLLPTQDMDPARALYIPAPPVTIRMADYEWPIAPPRPLPVTFDIPDNITAATTEPPVVVVPEVRGGDDKPPATRHPGWNRKHSELKRSRELRQADEIRALYRKLQGIPEAAERVAEIGAALSAQQSERKEDPFVALAKRIESLDTSAAEIEIALRLLATEIQRQQDEDDELALALLLALV